MPSETPVRQATCEGVPIDRYGYAWVLGEAPDLVDPAPMQEGNEAPMRKVHPKKAAEIGMNRLGATTTRMPRTPENDYLPLEAIHLIDGNLQTCWCSRSQSQPDVEPVWIRLDLPVERVISGWCCASAPSGPPRDGGQGGPGPRGGGDRAGDARRADHQAQPGRPALGHRLRRPHRRRARPRRVRLSLRPSPGQADLDHRAAPAAAWRTGCTPSRSPRCRCWTRRGATWPWPPPARA